MIYLDNAATTLMKPPEVLGAVQQAMLQSGSLGRSSHDAAAFASEIAYLCRSAAAALFDAEIEKVVFTFNATHGLNIAIHSLVKPGDKVVVSGFEHNAVMRPLYHIGANIVVAGKKLFDPEDALTEFEQAIDKSTKAVICTHISNVFGYILPIKEIANICTERGVPLIIDAAQSAGVIPISQKELNAAYIAMPGHKGLMGPQGTGILICGNFEAVPILYGGTGSHSTSMEMPDYLPDRLESGTHNIHGIAGLLEGIKFVTQNGVKKIGKHDAKLIQLLSNLISNDKVKIFNGQFQSGVVSFIPTQGTCENAARLLNEAGFAVRSGLQCAPLAHKSAGTLSTGTVRVSTSYFNDRREIEAFASFINQGKWL